MSRIELANTNNTLADFSTPERLIERITAWIFQPSNWDDRAQSTFVQLIDQYAVDIVNSLKSHIESSKAERVRAIQAKLTSDMASSKLKLFLIAKSLGCGTLGGLASAQIATQVAVALAIVSYSTPVGWISGAGTFVFHYQIDRRAWANKLRSKALLEIEKTKGVAGNLLLFVAKRQSDLAKRQLNLELNGVNRDISELKKTNKNLDSQLATSQSSLKAASSKITKLEDFLVLERDKVSKLNEFLDTERGRITELENSLDDERTQVSDLHGFLNTERGRITLLLNTQRDLQGLNTNLDADLDTARNRISSLESLQTTANEALAASQRRISTMDGNVAALQGENQDLRTSLTFTAAKINELQSQNQQNLVELRAQSVADLASVQQMNRDLVFEVRADFESRERSAAAKQIADLGIEKALREEQENQILKLNVALATKSAAFEVLQSEHDQLADQISHKFDVMTKTMSCNPTESSVNKLLRSDDQRNLSNSVSESNSDFIEVAQEM